MRFNRVLEHSGFPNQRVTLNELHLIAKLRRF